MPCIWRELVRRRWWTDISGISSNAGMYSARCYLGSVKVTLDVAGKKSSALVDARQPASQVTVHLAP